MITIKTEKIDDVYLGYTYKGTIVIKHGCIEIEHNPRLWSPACTFIDDTGHKHFGLCFEPYYSYYGRLWGKDKQKIKEIIQERYRKRIREIETSNALAYAEMIVSESGST